MINFSGLELIVFLLAGILFLGPEQMKQVAGFLGRVIRGVKNITRQITEYLESSADDQDNKHR